MYIVVFRDCNFFIFVNHSESFTQCNHWNKCLKLLCLITQVNVSYYYLLGEFHFHTLYDILTTDNMRIMRRRIREIILRMVKLQVYYRPTYLVGNPQTYISMENSPWHPLSIFPAPKFQNFNYFWRRQLTSSNWPFFLPRLFLSYSFCKWRIT